MPDHSYISILSDEAFVISFHSSIVSNFEIHRLQDK